MKAEIYECLNEKFDDAVQLFNKFDGLIETAIIQIIEKKLRTLLNFVIFLIVEEIMNYVEKLIEEI